MLIIGNIVVQKTDRRIFLKQFNEALASQNTEEILNNVTEDIRWKMVGNRTIVGRDNLKRTLIDMQKGQRTDITLDRIIVDGHEAAVTGVLEVSTEEGSSMYAFSDVYRFAEGEETKINELTSYVVRLGKPS